MSDPVSFCLLAAVAYLAGSLPFGLWMGFLGKGVDVRTLGSGNIGATNVARVIGMKWGIATLLFDALKGLLPTLLLPMLFFDAETAARSHACVLAAICTILGHMFSVFLRFRGGKGVATALGVVIVISWIGAVVGFVVFWLIVLPTQLVAVGSMAAAISFAITVFVVLAPAPFADPNWSTALFALAVPVLIIVRHRSNIVRLLAGKDERFQAAIEQVPPKSSSSDAEATSS